MTSTGGCTATANVVITQPTLLTSSITAQTNISCAGGANGSATVTPAGGTAPYTYLWNDPAPAQTTATSITLTVGTWTVTVTDANGCTSTSSATITQPTAVTASISAQTNVSCNGGSNGSATASAGGGTAPYTYLWNDPAPAQTTATCTALTLGTWTVTVTDANGCTATTSATITQPTALTATTTGTAASCNGGSNGTATVTPVGGTGPYTYGWVNLQTTQTATSLIAGTYGVTVTDANGCTTTSSYVVTQPAAIVLTPSHVDATCGMANGSASIAVAGGTAPYSYLWSNGGLTNSIAAVLAGAYTVTVTDNNGCTSTNTINVNNSGAPTATITASTNVSCNGGSNGSATVTAVGGTAPYTYLWNDPAPAQTTVTCTALTAGTWSVTVTDFIGCQASASITITQPTALTASITSQTNVSCNAGANGTGTVAASGGTTPYTYLWNDPAPAQTTATSTALTVGSWTVTVTDANLCTTTATVNITQPTAVVATISSQTNVSCNGGTNGTATVAGSGGTPGYTFNWSNSQSTAIASGLGAATFQVTVTDSQGCTATNSATITQPTAVTANISAQTNVSCNGGANGTATVTAGGGTPGYTYLWNDPAPAQITATATALTFGSWTVTVTDVNLCTATTTVNITQPTVVTATISAQTNVSCNGGANGTGTVTAGGGTPGYTYLWNDPAPAQTTATSTTLTVGTWTVTVSDLNLCTATATVAITQPTILSASISSQTNVSCNGGANGQATVSGSGGTLPYTYLWNDPAPAQTTATATALTNGTWTVTVTDANLCTTTTTVNITQPVALSASIVGTNVSCNGGSTGAANLTATGGTLPYTYLWTNTATSEDINSLSFGSYTVTVTDGNSCTTTATVNITQPTIVTATITASTNATGAGLCNGTATVAGGSGTPGYTYLWSTTATTAPVTGLCAGTYTVTVTDANGCTAVTTVTIVEPNAVVATITAQTNVTCNGLCNGSATVSVTGGVPAYTYLWSSGALTATAPGLCAGIYFVTVTDNNGITGTTSVTITSPTALSATIVSQTNVSCNGGANGQATVSGSGGTLPYTYLWNDPAPAQTTATVMALTNGPWGVTLTDANLCTTTATVNITQPVALTASIVGTPVLCNGGSSGAANLTASGGTLPYTYLWTNTATSEDINSLSFGSYTVTVTDGNSCTTTATVNITQPTIVTATITASTNATGAGLCNGTATVAGGSGTPGYTYLWSTTATTASVTGLCAGTYTVTVTDANGCTAVTTVTIVEPNAVVVTITATTNVNCNGLCTGSATSSVTGGVGPYTYLWPNTQTTAIATNLCAGSFIVTVTDNNGNTGTATATITQPSALTSSIGSQTNVSCNGGSNGSAMVAAGGGTAPYTYLWNDPAPAQTTATCTGLTNGPWSVTVTDANGCTSVSSVTITQPTALTANIVGTAVLCNGGSTGAADLTAGGGTSPYTYNWSNSMTTEDLTGLSANTYLVTVTDNLGCTATANVTINQPTAVTATTTVNNAHCGQADGSSTVTPGGGTPGYTYLWTGGQTTVTATGLLSGLYSVTVTDLQGCIAIATSNISNLSGGIATISSSTPVSCNGGGNGAATATMPGAVTYLWDNGAVTATVNNLTAGAHSVTVTDNNGCTSVASVTIIQPTLVTSTLTGTNALCSGSSNGSADLTPSNGTPGYTYLWSNAATTQDISGVIANTYNVTITDANGCTATNSVVIGQPTVVTSSISASTNASCNGGSNGTATVTAGGGTPGYTYLWNGGVTPTVAANTGFSAGNYSVTVTDTHGCTALSTFTITQPTVISLTTSSLSENCGQGNGSATVIAAGGTVTTGYLYNWSGGSTPAQATTSNLTFGTYNITVTDNNGCTAVSSTTVGNIAPGVATISSSTNVSCSGLCNGSATVSVGGGVAPYSYLWSNAQTSATANGLCVGVYSVTTTDANTCHLTAFVTITQPVTLTNSFSSDLPSCYGICDGSIFSSVTGGSTPYSYQWNDPTLQTTATATALCAGTYSMTVTDANGCNLIAPFTLSQPPQITTIATATDAHCGQPDGSLDLTVVNGSPPFIYLWSNGVNVEDPTNIAAGSYSVTVTDFKGCTGTGTYVVNNLSGPTSSILSFTNVSCFNQCNGTAQVNATGGQSPYTYLWDNAQTGQTGTALCAGNHSVTVTDIVGCEAISNVVITQPNALTGAISSVSPSCNNSCNGTATELVAGGTTPYTYHWTNNDINAMADSLCAGSYTVIVTDAHSCTISSTILINQPQFIAISMTSTPVLCNGACNGTATASPVGGIPPYTYLWSDLSAQTTQTAIGLCAGNYTVSVFDTNGCLQTSNVTITQPAILTSSITNSTNISCFGGNNGSAQVTVNGGSPGYSFNWSNSQVTQSISNLVAGVYGVTVTDLNGCTSTSQVILTEPPVLSVALSPANENCFNACDGLINSSITGGTGPYVYAWTNAQATANISNLCVGSYTVTVTDSHSCSVVATSSISGPPSLQVVVTGVIDADCGQPNGSATVAVSGGTGSVYVYSWNPNVSSSNAINNVIAGAYNVTVTDVNGCTATTTVNVNNNLAPVITNISVTNVSCFGGNNGTASVTFTSSTVINTIQWSDPLSQSTNTAIGLTYGSYYVVITDANGCTVSGNAPISQPQQMFSIINASAPALCYGSCDGSASVLTAGGTTPYSYNWLDPSGQTTQSASGLCAGNVSVIVTDVNGCTAIASTNISQPTLLQVSGVTTPVNCNGGSDGSITASVTGGTPGYGYSWIPIGGTTSVAANLSANYTYTVIVTDVHGCTAQANFNVSEPSPIVIQITPSPARCNVDNGLAVATVSGGTPAYTYNWSPSGSTTPVANNLAPGVHLLTVIDSHNCLSTSSSQIFELPMPEFSNAVVTNTSCYGSADGVIQIHVLFGQLPINYNWAPYGSPDSISSNLIAGTYTVSINDANGCQIISPPIVVNQPTPVVVFANGTDTVCIGQPITISASANGGTPGYTYMWSNGLGTNQSQTIYPLVTTSYSVTATDSHGCTSSVPGFVTLNVNPPLNVTLPSDVDICEGQSLAINAVASGGDGGPYIFNWNLGGGNPNTVSPTSTTTYIVTVYDLCHSPTDNDTMNVTVHPRPQIIAPPLSANGCEPVVAVFNNVVNGDYTYMWNFGDPSSGDNTSTDSIPTHVYSTVGSYDVSLVLTTQYGCQTTATYTNLVNVTPAPVAGFTFYPDGVSVFDANIQFYDQSTNAAYWTWTFGDGNNATVPDPQHQYSYADTFLVTLAVKGLNGCVDTISRSVHIIGEITFYAPNAFAPDGLSGYFYPKGMGFNKEYYELIIYDRWGQIIFQTNKYPEGTETTSVTEGGWNGKYKNTGAVVPVGVYTWIVKYKDIRGIGHEYVGSVTVVR